MSDGEHELATAGGRERLGDRRKPVARYVEFGAESTQARLIKVAEEAFQVLTRADDFEGTGQVVLRTAPPPGRRGLLRRARPAPGRVVPTTAALARIAHAVSAAPEEVAASSHACRASYRVASTLASVTTDLLRDLLVLEPAEQADHPAYRQTLRLAAELQALRDIVSDAPCADPEGCVGIRSPERWGRRLEDVEVSEVRAVLLRLSRAGGPGNELGAVR